MTPDRDPAKPDDLWTRRVAIRGLLVAGIAMRPVVRLVVILTAPMAWKF